MAWDPALETAFHPKVITMVGVSSGASSGGLRIIDPNCMGLYVPKVGVGSFDKLPKESEPVAFISLAPDERRI